MVDLTTLRDAALLDGLTVPELRELGSVARERETRKGEQLIARGEEAEALYLVLRGQVDLSVRLRAAGSQAACVMESLARGDAFGWSALVEPRRYIYFAHCAAEGSVVELPRGPLEALLEGSPGLGYRLQRNLSRLVGSRARVLQQCWTEEVERSIARVGYWTQHRMIENHRRDGEAEAVALPQRRFWQGSTAR